MSPEISQVKAALRAERRAARIGRITEDPGFTDQLRDLIAGASVIAGYIGYGTEPVITQALTDAISEGKEVLLPILRSDNDLEWGRWHGQDLIHRGNLQEPETGTLDEIERADLVIVPALVVDLSGVRLGQGGGSYDRVLSRISSQSVAVVYDDEVVEQLPRDEHDQLVTLAVTPKRTIRF